ncbi:MAG: NADH-quinone oxidoreductase subunit G, partial [Thiomonas arsenitoxydans]|nr:NADH-quinone oxidoreductase subunit G [Thiomonas arsenitoxydans]
GLQNGDSVRVKVDTVDAQSVVLPARCDDALAPTVVSIAAAWAEAAPLGALGAMSGAVQVERVSAVAAVPAAAVPTAPASPERV